MYIYIDICTNIPRVRAPPDEAREDDLDLRAHLHLP